MKKIAVFAVALALIGFTACSGNKKGDAETTDADTTTTMVETGASESIENAEKVDEVLNQDSEDELFGTDVDDAEVENATKK